MAADTFRYASPLGEMSYRWDGAVCREVCLLTEPGDLAAGNDPVSRWLDAYFAGDERALPPLALARTPFQARMRECLLRIHRGETLSYGEIAKRLGTAPRAMGQALGANPLPVLIPCHRVVAVNGIGGFSGPPQWKRRLLAFEAG